MSGCRVTLASFSVQLQTFHLPGTADESRRTQTADGPDVRRDEREAASRRQQRYDICRHVKEDELVKTEVRQDRTRERRQAAYRTRTRQRYEAQNARETPNTKDAPNSGTIGTVNRGNYMHLGKNSARGLSACSERHQSGILSGSLGPVCCCDPHRSAPSCKGATPSAWASKHAALWPRTRRSTITTLFEACRRRSCPKELVLNHRAVALADARREAPPARRETQVYHAHA